MTAIFFCCGLALGVVLGACLWSGAQYLARIAATAEHRRQLATYRQQVLSDNARKEKLKADIRLQYGDELTKQQEAIMEKELSTVFQSRQNPG